MLRAPHDLVESLARAFLLVGSLAPALIYVFVAYSGMTQMAAEDARIQAVRASYAIAANPEIWQFATERLVNQVAEIRHAATHTILTGPDGKVLAQIGEECTGVCVSAHAPLLDFGKATGELRVNIDMAPVLVKGTILGILGIIVGFLLLHFLNRIVLERSRSERIAERERLRLQAILKMASDGIHVIDSDGLLVEANDAFLNMLGYDGSVIGKLHVADWSGKEPWEAIKARNDDLIARHGQALFEAAVRRRDGAILDVEISASGIEIGGKDYLYSAFRDISARKQAEAAREQLEAQLRESQKMEALGMLAGGVAHDFNNALAVILGNVELARQDVGSGHAALVSLEEIGKASRQAKNLVQQILSFGRRQKLERKATSLALVVVESARLMRATLPAKVSLNVECRGDAPVVLADATQINQILLNLCNNALQAVQDQERPGEIDVRLEAHSEARGDRPPGRYACLTVRDNGRGMDEATRSRIFEPFFTTKPRGKGTGLGLSVVHGIVQAHDASIDVESTAGEGSTFRIYFPALETQVPEVAAPTADTAPARGRGKHILYVDDDEAIVFLMQRLLQRQGYRVSGYTDPREALTAARANPGQFDLAVTDYNMPGMSGLELAHALRKIRADLPVVLASGYITEELRQEAPAAGIRELIYKPNTVDELCEAVARFANAQSGDQGLS